MQPVRPFRKSDSSQVADLHRRVFKTAATFSATLEEEYERYFDFIFLNNPWATPDIPSLVFEQADGKIVGFLGVMPRPLLFRDEPIMAAVSSQLIVDPAHRSTLAGVQLLKTFLSGPQDLSLADEAGETPKKIWKALGGYSAIPQSIHWVKVFRPGEFLLSRLKRRHSENSRGLNWKAALAAPICRFGDVLASAIPGHYFSAPPPVGNIEEPSIQALVSCLEKPSRTRLLRPAYDVSSLRWLLEILERHTDQGSLRKGMVRNARTEIVGWYVYYANPRGLGDVLQVYAEENSREAVLNQLLFDASQHGVAALCGRLEPDFMDELRKQRCLLYNRGQWTLVHSRNPVILQTIRCGDAFLSRLEGEYCSHFGHPAFSANFGKLEVSHAGWMAHAPLATTTASSSTIRKARL